MNQNETRRMHEYAQVDPQPLKPFTATAENVREIIKLNNELIEIGSAIRADGLFRDETDIYYPYFPKFKREVELRKEHQ